MRIPAFMLFAAMAVPCWAQQTQPSSPADELPSAPSAAKAPKPAPPPPPAPAPKPQPVETAPPATASESGASQATTSKPDTSAPAPSDAPEPSNRGAAQPASPAGGGSDENSNITIRSRVDEVNVIFTVTDKHGHFVKNLKANDVSVLDDNKPPQTVVNFRSETDLPLRVGLLVDASNSIRDRFKFEQEAAVEFLSQIVRPKSDRAFVLGFDTTAEVTQDFTDDTEKLSHGVRELRPGGGTALYDAIYYACRDKLGKINPGMPVRRAIILLTDGEDNQSRVTREEAIEMAQRAEVIVYAISTNVSGMKLRGDKVLERIAEATGGRAFFPFKVEDIANFFSAVQDELRSQYAIAYRPADFRSDGRYRSIEILAANKGLKVRARKGYFAPRQ
jgi:Ca-activated chloride channel homolog